MKNNRNQRPEENWPLIRIEVPGGRSYLVKGLRGPEVEGGNQKNPFDVELKKEGTLFKGKVNPGIVASILPENIFEEFTINQNTTYWICEMDTDGKTITSCKITTSTSPPNLPTLVPSALPAKAQFVFAITKDGKAFRTIGPGNPVVTYSLVLETDKTTPPPAGVPGVDRWYNITVS
jgi:hypothetical protein